MTSLSAPTSRRSSPNPAKKHPSVDEPRCFVDIHTTTLPTLDPLQYSQYVSTSSQYFNDTTDFHHYHYKDVEGAKVQRDHNGFTPDSIFYEPPSHDDIFDAGSDSSSSSSSSTGSASPPTSGISKNSIFDVPSLAPRIPFIRSARSRNAIFDTPPSTEPSLKPPPNPLKQNQASQENDEAAWTRTSSQRLLGADSKRLPLSPHASVLNVDSPSGLAKKNSIFWDTTMTAAVTPPHTSQKLAPSLDSLGSLSSTPRSATQSPSLIQLPFGNTASRTISPSSFSSPPAHLGPTTPPTLPDPSCPTLIPPQDISLVLLPTRKNLLGVGRHAQVYKATFTTPQFLTPRLCAAKRLNPNKESQTLGLSEAYILRRLTGTGGQHQNIIQLIGVKDEASFQTPLHSTSTFSPQATTPTSSPMAPVNGVASPAGTPAGTPSTPSSDLPQDERDSPPRLVLLLEYCANGSLWDWVQANKMKIGRRLWMKWARQLASAMERVHTVGLVHHDIKPHNVLLTEMLDVKLSDFGTAVFTQATQPLQDGLGKGTPPYSPPELLVSPPYPYSFSVDIFSLGVTLFVIGITGEEPYLMIRSPIELLVWVRKGGFWEWEERLRTLTAKDSPPSRRDSMSGVVRYLNGEPVPQPILSLLKRMMAPRPEDRPTAVEVVEKLRLLDWGEETPGLGGGEGFDWERKGDQSLFGAPDEEERQVDEMMTLAAGQKNGQSSGRT